MIPCPYRRFLCIAIAVFCTSPLSAQPPIHNTLVSGKEYSENGDQDQFAVGDPLQNLRWTGAGTTFDAFDYTNSGPPPADPDQVDALANGEDYLFAQVQSNRTPFVISLTGLSDVFYHNPTGTTGVWATKPQVRNNPRLSDDLDALELWGDASVPQDGTTLIHGDDANFYSVKGDFIIPNGIPPAISIYRYDPTNHISSIFVTHDQIRNAVAQLINQNPDFDIDVDALMVNGNDIMFSLVPNSQAGLDGGEIFTWTIGMPSAQYLVHGGRIWDTNNPVGAIFGVNVEDIDAFEAVIGIPEPGLGLVSVLACALISCVYRRRRHAQ